MRGMPLFKFPERLFLNHRVWSTNRRLGPIMTCLAGLLSTSTGGAAGMKLPAKQVCR